MLKKKTPRILALYLETPNALKYLKPTNDRKT
jgi:hypothetical protein